MRIGGAVMKPWHTPEEWLKWQRELTASAVIFPVQCDSPVALQEEYLACIRENGLVIGEVGIWRNVLDEDPEKQRENIDYAIEQLALAERVGANCCVNISGSRGAAVWDGYHPSNYTAEIYDRIVELTRMIIDTVKPVKTKFALEPMPWMLPDSPESYLKLLRDVDRPAFGVHMDYTNMVNSLERYHGSRAFIRHCFELLGDRICSIHLKDAKLGDGDLPLCIREVIPGRGAFDLADIVRCCESVSPEVTVFTEHLNSHEEYLEAIGAIRAAGESAGVRIL